MSTPQKNNISFSSILQNSKKSNVNSERRLQRESSISKLRDKLFGMKKVISEKSRNEPFLEVTPSKKKEV